MTPTGNDKIDEIRERLVGVEQTTQDTRLGLVRLEGKLDRHDATIEDLGSSVQTIKKRLFDAGGMTDRVTELVAGQKLGVRVLSAIGGSILAVLVGLVVWILTRETG